MAERIHDDEPDTGESVVQALLAAECPWWSRLPIEYLSTSGTDNAMWRIVLDDQPDAVVRLPRRPGAAAGVEQELSVLQHVGQSRIGSLFSTPLVLHAGQPQTCFPHHWSVLRWIDGSDLWTSRTDLTASSLAVMAQDLALAVQAIGETAGADVSERVSGDRGGPLGPLLDELGSWLDDPQWNAEHLVDVTGIRRLIAQGLEVADEPVSAGFVHGDLIPGNLLAEHRRLAAVIDWGGAGWGDRAQDLAPAWSVLGAAERRAFREALEVDEATWLRGRTFELEHAVGGVLYYVPRGHVLGDVMQRTLERILVEAL